MSKYRILILTNRVPFPLNDGGALAMQAMIEGYHEAGWEVFLLAMNTSRHHVAVESLPALYRNIHFRTYDIDTDIKVVPLLRNFFFSRKPNHADRFHCKGFEVALAETIGSFRPHIIQMESVYLASYIPFIRQATDAAVSLRLHNIEYQVWERLGDASGIFKRLYLRNLAARIRKFEVAAWNAADILIPITETDADLVRQLTGCRRIFTTPFGIEAQEPAGRLLYPESWQGYHVGAMDWLPNVEAIKWFLETVWPQLHRELPEFRFYFAGRNMKVAFDNFEKDGVVSVGEVADAEDFIAGKKILIVPLRSGGGIRIKILEAMAAEKLVVSTAVGMQGIPATPGMHYLAADSAEDFIRQLKWALENKQAAGEIAKSAAVWVRELYDRKRVTGRLVAQVAGFVSGGGLQSGL